MPEPWPSYVLNLDEATDQLGDIEAVTAGGVLLRVALPATARPTPRAAAFALADVYGTSAGATR